MHCFFMWPHRVRFINSQWIKLTYVHHHNVVKPAVGVSGLVVSVCVFNSPPLPCQPIIVLWFFCSTNTLENFLRNYTLILLGDYPQSHIVQFKKIQNIVQMIKDGPRSNFSFTYMYIFSETIYPATSGYWCDCKFPDPENLFFCWRADSKDDPYGKCWFGRPRSVRYSHPGWISNTTQCLSDVLHCARRWISLSHINLDHSCPSLSWEQIVSHLSLHTNGDEVKLLLVVWRVDNEERRGPVWQQKGVNWDSSYCEQ